MHLETVNYHYDASKREPKYLQLANALEHWIRSSDLSPGEKFPSDRQLAEFFKMGTLTVTRGVNELVERKLLERRVGSGTYLVPPRASPKWPASRRIGLICHEVMREDGFFVTTVRRRLQEETAARQLDLVQMTRVPEQYEETIHEYQLGAMIVLAPQEPFIPEMRRLAEAGFPLVALGAYLPDIAGFSFGTQHAATAALAVNYLVQNGCRRIGIVLRSSPGAEMDLSVRERERGYLEGMWRNRQLVNPNWIFRKHYGDDAAFNAALRREFAASEGGPDALLITGLADSLVLYSMLRELGKTIPDDISLVAFDDAEYTSLLEPPLTVWRQGVDIAVREAIHSLSEQMAHRPVPPHAPAPALLIERGSCKKIKVIQG